MSTSDRDLGKTSLKRLDIAPSCIKAVLLQLCRAPWPWLSPPQGNRGPKPLQAPHRHLQHLTAKY